MSNNSEIPISTENIIEDSFSPNASYSFLNLHSNSDEEDTFDSLSCDAAVFDPINKI